MCTKFGPDRLEFARAIPERLLFGPPKSSDLQSHYNNTLKPVYGTGFQPTTTAVRNMPSTTSMLL